MQVKIPYPLCGRRPDGSDLGGADFARISVELKKDFEERLHAVRAGEDDPVIGMRVLHQLRKFTQVRRRCDSNRRQFDDVASESSQFRAQYSRLAARSCHDDSLSKKWPIFEPAQLVP